MKRCYYCRQAHAKQWTFIVHQLGCPQVIPAYRHEYEEGEEDGRRGMKARSNHPAYMMGYHNGERALEEAENGQDPRMLA